MSKNEKKAIKNVLKVSGETHKKTDARPKRRDIRWVKPAAKANYSALVIVRV